MSNKDELEVKVWIERGDSEIEVDVLVTRYGSHEPDWEYEYNKDVFTTSEQAYIEERAFLAYIDYYDKNPQDSEEVQRADYMLDQMKDERLNCNEHE